MDLVYLDSDILGDSYDAKLCRKRFIRYAQDHPPVLIAVARVDEAEREVWNSLKQACSFVRYFLDDQHPCEQLDGLTVELQPQCLQCGTRKIHPEPGAAAWIQTETDVSWRYIELDMLSDPAFSYYHHMKTFSDLHSAYVYIRIRNGIHKILN